MGFSEVRAESSAADGEVLDLGGKQIRRITTPHVPDACQAQVLHE